MFQPNSKINVLDPAARQVQSIYSSINQPTVALEAGNAKPTFAYICSMWDDSGRFLDTFVLLFQPETDIAIFYTHSQGAVPEKIYQHLEKDALNFVESMGFMMDDLHFQEIDPEKQVELFETLPLFMQDRSSHKGSIAAPNEQQEAGEAPMATDASVDADPDEAPALGDLVEEVSAINLDESQAESLVELDADAIVVFDKQEPPPAEEEKTQAFDAPAEMDTGGMDLLANLDSDEFVRDALELAVEAEDAPMLSTESPLDTLQPEPPLADEPAKTEEKETAPVDVAALARLLGSF